MKAIYFVRHGQAEDDVLNLYGGSADHESTAKALKEAEKFAEEFRGRIDLVVTSPYLRARRPAEVAAKKLKVPLAIEEDLRERNQYGVLTGMNKDEAAKKYPDLVAALQKPASQVEGAEPNEFFRKRVREAADRLWRWPEQNMLVFTHMGPMLAILDLHFGDFEVEHFGWFKLTREAGKWKLLAGDKITFRKKPSLGWALDKAD